MLQSMTGFGKASVTTGQKKITIETRSLNSKQLDVFLKTPPLYKEKEMDIRNLVSHHLSRGKIEVAIHSELTGEQPPVPINTAVVTEYLRQLQELSGKSRQEAPADLLQIAMNLPDTLKNEREQLLQDEWNAIEQCMEKCLQEVTRFRTREGKALEGDIRKRVGLISGLLDQTGAFEERRMDHIRRKIRTNLEKLHLAKGPDENRFEQELIYYLEKLDITEEKIRLTNHCEYFLETLDQQQSEGKKLGFITQEMGREINTLGAKASDTALQRLVVEMKNELEKIREQILNVL